ncbi:hypothetical protein HYY75_10170, partial [bacterium]|nr:hypothetical protein [bacterium]
MDFAFLAPYSDELKMRKAGVPLLIGTSTKRAPSQFDVVAISNSIVQELLNLPALLEYSGIPLSREARKKRGSPFILLGGSNAYSASILHGPVSFGSSEEGLVDGVIIGDGEEAFQLFLECFLRARFARREELMAILRDRVPGFYDPSCYVQKFDKTGRLFGIEAINGASIPVKAHRVSPQNAKKTFSLGPIPFSEEAAGASHLLISEGCPYFCSFCKESWEQKPYREGNVSALISDSLALKANLGISELNLMTFNVNTFSKLSSVLNSLEPLFDRVTVKSQRFDTIAQFPFLLDR